VRHGQFTDGSIKWVTASCRLQTSVGNDKGIMSFGLKSNKNVHNRRKDQTDFDAVMLLSIYPTL